jgi:riboflavin biosynthesis pyrimidine reductase
MKPHIICHIMASLDGRIHPSRWTASTEGDRGDWSAAYEKIHKELGGNAWIVGRVTMAQMSKAVAHAPAKHGPVSRPNHFANRKAEQYAIAVDRAGKLHFSRPDIGGDAVVVLLGHDVPDSHLAELAGDSVSYIVAEDSAMELRPMLETLGRELGIRRLLLEGGGQVNGSFLAAGLVDEVSLLVGPAIDGGLGITGAFDAGEGLAGKVQLTFVSARTLDHGLVHLRYSVAPDKST